MGPGPDFDRIAPEMEGLGWALDLSAAVDSALHRAVLSGMECHSLQGFAFPVDGDGLEEARASWEQMGGQPGAEELFWTGSDWSPSTPIPLPLLQQATLELTRLRQEERKPSPWLFMPSPLWGRPHPDEQSLIERLEALTSSVDRRSSALAGAEEPGDLMADRQELLKDLEAAGLLCANQADGKGVYLRTWEAETLQALYAAALELLAYLDSPERKAEVPGARSTGVRGAAVCLDLFRSGIFPPDGVSRFEWAAVGERVLRGGTFDGGQGAFFVHTAQGWTDVVWRKDDGHTPALLAVQRR